ncbi:hypothetical protein [Streptacidiphilus sp. EB103A]|uniref:hypothetical protein n=1 Tax=Streptacidiphilus sp. EB103A TaxID=3156275 RepID=UPI003519CA9F
MYQFLRKLAGRIDARLAAVLGLVLLLVGVVLTVALSHGKSQSAYSSLPQCAEQEGAAVTLNCIEQINQWCQVHEPQVDLSNCSADVLTWVATNH